MFQDVAKELGQAVPREDYSLMYLPNLKELLLRKVFEFPKASRISYSPVKLVLGQVHTYIYTQQQHVHKEVKKSRNINPVREPRIPLGSYTSTAER